MYETFLYNNRKNKYANNYTLLKCVLFRLDQLYVIQ